MKNKYKELIKSIFPNLPQGNTIVVRINYPKIVAEVKDENNNVLISGLAKCSPEDRWDEYTGVTLALTRLRININSFIVRKEKTNKQFVPNVGEVYFFPFIQQYKDGSFGEPDGKPCKWVGNDLDLIRLSLGNVYRTKREANKAIRRNVLNGRSIVKEARKNVQ